MSIWIQVVLLIIICYMCLVSSNCPSNHLMVTRVQNPPYAMRTFTDRKAGTGLLDLTRWTPNTYDNSQYMQIDLGEELTVVGIRTQIDGFINTQYTCTFNVQHAGSTGGYTLQNQVHTLVHNHQADFVFTTSVYARYIRVVVTRWNQMLGISAGLVVRICSQCIDGAVIPVGNLSALACQCTMNTYLDVSATDNRAIALMLGTTLLSTLAKRSDNTQKSTAVFNSSAGPPNARGAVTFLASENRFLDGGAHTFDPSGGFTVVMLIKFNGWGGEEIIFHFASQDNWDDIVLLRSGVHKHFVFWINTPGATTCLEFFSPVVTPGIWNTIIVKYVPLHGSVEIKFNNFTKTLSGCWSVLKNRNWLSTFVGRSFLNTDERSFLNTAYLNADVAGFYAVDRLLPVSQISNIVARMGRGEDVLQACVACSAPKKSLQGSIGAEACLNTCQSNSRETADGSACVCNAGFQSSAGNIGQIWVNETSTCNDCITGKFKTSLGSSACEFCPPGKFQLLTGKSFCESCAPGKFKPINGTGGCLTCSIGQTLVNETSTCEDCIPGKFKPINGTGACLTCSLNETSGTGFSSCVNCNIGQTWVNETSTCEDCIPGKFKPINGTGACLTCSPKQTSGIGFSSCVNCKTWVNETSTCEDYIPGKFKTSLGSNTCEYCQQGKLQTSLGSSSCEFCPSGKFQSLTGKSFCESCAPGKFQENVGEIFETEACLDCPDNSISPVASNNQTNCMCIHGFTGTSDGLCKMCEPGTYKEFIGSGKCSNCPVGKYASEQFGSVSEDNCSQTFTLQVSFSLNIEEQIITNDLRIQIIQNVAERIDIESSRISELTFRSVSPSVRRLLSVRALFIISKNSLTQALIFQEKINITVLNEILQSVSNNTITATDLDNIISSNTKIILANAVLPSKDVSLELSLSLNTSSLMIIAVSSVGVISICLLFCNSCCKEKKISPTEFNVSKCEYCQMSLYSTF